MVTISNNLNLSQLAPQAAKSLTAMLKVGQVLEVNINKIDGQNVTMKIGANQLNAMSLDKSLSLGNARVVVTQTEPQLKISLQKTASQPPNAQQTLQTTLKLLLPNQVALSQSLTNLTQIANLPNSIQAPLQQLLDLLQKPQNRLNGKALKEDIANSGQFFESKLSKADQALLTRDSKAKLLELLKQSQPTQASNTAESQALKNLSKELISAINRISLNQFQQLENPINMSLQILREHNQTEVEEQLSFKNQKAGNTQLWQVLLRLEFPQGNTEIQLSLTEKNQLYCLFWCEEPTYRQYIDEHQEELIKAFEHLGLEASIQMSQQPLADKSSETSLNRLIDIQI